MATQHDADCILLRLTFAAATQYELRRACGANTTKCKLENLC